jgi:hypothetical protein
VNRTLWQWSRTRDEWLYVITVPEEQCRMTLRGNKRRNPLGTRFRWRDEGEGPPKRYRQRSVKG